jgi:uncharacterized protein (DUF1330 family)
MMKPMRFVLAAPLIWYLAASGASHARGASDPAGISAPASDPRARADRHCHSLRSGRPAYLVITMTILDPHWVPGYERQDVPRLMMQKYGACYVVRSARPEKIEGDGDTPSVVAVIEFPSIREAKRFLTSPEYAPVGEARRRAAKTQIYAVEE